jgi:Protein of unknown function (DUF1236)
MFESCRGRQFSHFLSSRLSLRLLDDLRAARTIVTDISWNRPASGAILLQEGAERRTITMKALVRNGTILLALLAGIGAAGAASVRSAGLDGLTDAQRQEIWQGVSKQATNESLPAGSKAAVGETAPGSIKIEPLPNDVSAAVPVVKSYDFAMAQGQVLIVDPSSKRIVDILSQ